jgi:hypothetical protein
MFTSHHIQILFQLIDRFFYAVSIREVNVVRIIMNSEMGRLGEELESTSGL